MQTHAHACNNSYQVLTLAFSGQVEGHPGTSMCLSYQGYFSIQTQAGTWPHMLGPTVAPALPVALRLGKSTAYQCALRGRGWQRGQLYDERFMNESRWIGVPHLLHGCPARPYASRERSKYPLSPFTFT
jgi:hypothetical protein